MFRHCWRSVLHFGLLWEGGLLIGGLDALLPVSAEEKEARGIRYTPHEIIQQPASWPKTLQIIQEQQSDLRQFLFESGFDLLKPSGNPTVILIGAGISDYVGRALTYLLRRTWGCEVWAVPSTDLLTNLEDLVFSERKYLWISFSRSGRQRGRIGRSGGGHRKISQRSASARHLQRARWYGADLRENAGPCISACFGRVRERSRTRNDEFLHKHGCCRPVCSPRVFSVLLRGNIFGSLRSGRAIPQARPRNSTVNRTRRVFQGLFCRVRRSGRPGVGTETIGDVCRKDTSDV